MFAALESCPLLAVAQPSSPYGATALPANAGSAAVGPMRIPVGGSIELKLRRLSDSVELVLEGVGSGPQLQQTTRGSSWEGMLLTSAPNSLRRGPQRFSLPEVGFQSVSIDGSGSTYRLQVTPMPGYPVGRPVVSADGRDLILSFAAPSQATLQTARPDLSQPGRVPQSNFVPPLQPRAVAPPLGDMAVGTMMLSNPSYVSISGPPVTMRLRNAPVKDVLLSLSQLGGYGFVYVEDCKNAGSTRPGGIDCDAKDFTGATANRKVTIAFRNENYSRAFNSTLLSAGLQGRRDGNMIVVGPNVFDKGFGATMSKVYRLNQVSSSAAADYLANLGASITKTNTITTAVTEGASQANAVAGAPNTATTNSSTSTTVEAYGSGVGPLRGLIGTTDTRLATITLVGPPQVVTIAEQYLKQLDLRQRQVALSVKILDVSLGNDAVTENSFAFRYGNNFIVNDGGRLLAAFGRNLPPGQADFTDGSLEVVDSNSTSSTNSGSSSGSSMSSGSNQSSNTSLSSGNSSSLGETSSSSQSVIDTDISSKQLTDTQIRDLNSTLSQTGLTLERAFSPLLGREGFAVVPINTSASQTKFAGTDTISRILSSTLGRNVNVSSSSSRNGTSLSNSASNDSSLGSQSSGSSSSGSQANGSSSSSSTNTSRTGARRVNPGLLYPRDSFFDFVQAVIVSSNTKVLASPTLILSENQDEIQGGSEVSAQISSSGATEVAGGATIGRPRANESFVTVGEQVITNYAVEAGQNGAPNTCQPEFGIAGLTFGARISKIDDNGFVTFSLSPQIAASTRQQLVPNCGLVDILAIRRLDTGSARVRDGQTLILTGVISDSDQQVVSKWPVLGDLPLIGQFFRSSGGSREKRELVIMVTPRILDDNQGGTYGYGFQPSTREARQLLSTPVQGPGLY